MYSELTTACNMYLNYIFKDIVKSSDKPINDLLGLDDWWHETFLFEASNNWKEGEHDFVKFLNQNNKINQINDLVNSNSFELIKYINTYYNDNYGPECIMDWRELNSEFIIRNFCYVYSHNNIEQIQSNIIDKIDI
jgi:hypothetical protein